MNVQQFLRGLPEVRRSAEPATPAQVSALARGATLAALRTHGWRMDTAGGRVHGPLAQASDDAADLGVQDLVVIEVKAPALAQLAPNLRPLLGRQSVVLRAMNGVSWWLCKRVDGVADGALHRVDPGGTIAAAIPSEQVLGCVVHAGAATSEPGLVQHRMGQGLIVDEPAGGASARAGRIATLLAQAGFEATASDSVRQDIWYKLWGNLRMNPVSAFTGATLDRVRADPLVRAFCSATMGEAAAIGARIGCPIAQSPEERHAITAKLGAFKSSMLQDAEAGRLLELDAIVGATCEIGQRLGMATPNMEALLGLARLFRRVRGLCPEGTTR